MDLSTLKKLKGNIAREKRVGRGVGSGHGGHTSGASLAAVKKARLPGAAPKDKNQEPAERLDRDLKAAKTRCTRDFLKSADLGTKVRKNVLRFLFRFFPCLELVRL